MKVLVLAENTEGEDARAGSFRNSRLRRRSAPAERPDLRVVSDRSRPSSDDIRAALPDLYEEHYRSLVRLASFSVDDRETAEEVVQDAFVKVVSGNYDIEPGKEAGYLRSMVLNGARSALRKRQVRRAHTPDAPDDAAAAEEAGVASTEHDRIIAAIRALPEKQAAVLMLRYYLDLSEAEIADTLGLARGSVKSHAHRGLKRLAVLLDDEAARAEGPRIERLPVEPPRSGEDPS